MNPTENPVDQMTAYCTPGHRRGSKPYVVPLAGNNQRETPLFLVYHGRDHLDQNGNVTRHPVHMTYADCRRAIDQHEEAVVQRHRDDLDRAEERRAEWWAD